MVSPPPTVVVKDCTIIGKTHAALRYHYPKAVDSFYGIPFATAGRFEAAVAVKPEPGTTIQAERPMPSVPWPFAPGEVAESPLRLNVFRPWGMSCGSTGGDDEGQDGRRSSGGLPVVIYIHGGAFNFSDPLERDMASFISWSSKDIVVVSISYRLSALGFLAGDEVDELNLGLRDQRLGIEWVREWVGAFGGDGEDLTVMGASAGAHSIGHHILHPTAPPFRKAILESGSATARSILSATHPRTLSNLSSIRSHAQADSLSTLSVEDLVEAEAMVWADNADSVCWPFQPVVDGPGGMVPHTPLRSWDDAVAGGRVGGMAVITGFCSHEGTNFVPQDAATNAEFLAFFKVLIPGLSRSDLVALEALYPDPVTNPSSPYTHPPKNRHGAQFQRLQEAYAHYAYICPILHTAHRLSQAGSTVYLYEFAALSAAFHAASHGDQAPIVAHETAALRGKPGLSAVAGEMNARWTAFAADKRGGLDGQAWPAFESPFRGGEGSGELLVFGGGNDEAAGGSCRGEPVRTRCLSEREREQCLFWWDKMELSQGSGRRA